MCNICKSELKNFIPHKEDKICPRCGSISRDRRLWQLLEEKYVKRRIRILDFSPSRSIYRMMKKNKSVQYDGSDLSGDFMADFRYDITNIETQDSVYDLIICYHVLEHVEEDLKAMQELYRVLNKDGFCIIQTPFKSGEIYENADIKTPQDRLKHFGQEDHVRIYSVSGLEERLKNIGFKVDINQFEEEESNRFGFNQNETILICSK